MRSLHFSQDWHSRLLPAHVNLQIRMPQSNIMIPSTGIVGEIEENTDGLYIWTHKKFDIGFNTKQIVDVNLTSEAKVKLAPNKKIAFTYEVRSCLRKYKSGFKSLTIKVYDKHCASEIFLFSNFHLCNYAIQHFSLQTFMCNQFYQIEESNVKLIHAPTRIIYL